MAITQKENEHESDHIQRIRLPDVLTLKEVDKPVVKETDVLVRVGAASVNAGDIFSMRGSPWLARFQLSGSPKPKTISSAGIWQGASRRSAAR